MVYNKARKKPTKFTKQLRELCCLSDDYEYTLYHEFSQTLIGTDEESVKLFITYISERNNPFDMPITSKVTNIVTGKEMKKETSSFLINGMKKSKDS